MASRISRPHVLANFRPSTLDKIADRRERAERKDERQGKAPAHLAAIRQLPCCIPGCSARDGIQAHHVKSAAVRGMGTKVPDKYTVPLCHEHHINGIERIGSRNEIEWFAKRGIDVLALAAALWAASPNVAVMTRIVQAHRADRGRDDGPAR